jgi:hypothetical protein
MYDIKQSTAITVPFFVHDASGDAVTGLTNASFTKRISKGSGAFAAMTVTITEMENGWYSFPLSTTHSNTLGLLTILFTNAGAKQVNLQWRVQAKLTDDLNDFDAANDDVAVVTTLTNLPAITANWLTATGIQAAALTQSKFGTNFIQSTSIATGAIAAAGIATDAFTAVKFASGSLDGKGDWNTGKTGYSISGTKQTLDALNDYDVTAQQTESYAVDGVAPTGVQFNYMIWSLLNSRVIVGTTLSAYEIDMVTVSMTWLLDNGTNPTDQRRNS